MKRIGALAIIIGLSVHVRAQLHSLELNRGWTIGGAALEKRLPAEVPGTVQLDLMRAGRLPDPFVANNIDSLQWVERVAWEYSLAFDLDTAMRALEHIDLVFKGLDTFASIELNGISLGQADNMFRSWRYAVKHLLKPGANELRVTFRPLIEEGRRARARYPLNLPHDSDTSGVGPFVRKAAYQLGWDFCPRLAACGIWRPVRLEAWNGLRIDDVRVKTAFAGSDAVVGVEVRCAGTPRPGDELVFDLDGQRTMVPIDPTADVGEPVRASLLVKDARRWWPQGEGGQVLYPAQVETRRNGVRYDRWQQPIGLRTMALDQHAGAFTFMVNDRPVFAKGANLVPPDLLLPRAGDSAWVALVAHMRRAHFNMVRVWAGGVYPPDAFFTACDTAGILVWQDLMFATMVPGDSAFTQNAYAEVIEQVERIDDHPCLALWCGNNELEVAWNNWGWQKTYAIDRADSARMASDNRRFFNELLPGWIATTSALPYTPTSPLSNWGNAAGLRTGDLHYWGVWHGDSTFSSFANNVGRFVSEYGFQSYPDSALLARYLPADQLVLGSPMLTRRQRSYMTDRPILEAIQRLEGRRPASLGGLIEGGQSVQAKGYRLAIEAHMAARPRCMGTLFWQLNDCWPGPSWSAVDVTGRWKPVMDEVQRLFAPAP